MITLTDEPKFAFFEFLMDAYPEHYAEIPATQKVISNKDFVVPEHMFAAWEEFDDHCG